MKGLSLRQKLTRKHRDVLTFKVEFTGMTEEDFAFLRKMAEDIKAEKEAAKAEKKKYKRAC